MGSAPIALAVDTPDLEVAAAWTRAAAPYISTVKVGLEAYLRHGAAMVDALHAAAPDLQLFLDLKLHDIPNTVAGAARSVALHHPRYLTVHALGGPEMIAAAAAALPETAITAVTVLTSHNAAQIAALGLTGTIEERVRGLAAMAVDAGARALVCSPHEVGGLRQLLGSHVDLITPGVRPAGASTDDQARVATPYEALRSGATLLVIGRPITAPYANKGEAGVADAARAIVDSLASGH